MSQERETRARASGGNGERRCGRTPTPIRDTPHAPDQDELPDVWKCRRLVRDRRTNVADRRVVRRADTQSIRVLFHLVGSSRGRVDAVRVLFRKPVAASREYARFAWYRLSNNGTQLTPKGLLMPVPRWHRKSPGQTQAHERPL